jgi:hypothetical protein
LSIIMWSRLPSISLKVSYKVITLKDSGSGFRHSKY